MIEAVNQAQVRPRIGDADELDAIAPIGRCGGGKPRLEKPDRFVGGVGTQRVVDGGRQPGRFVGRIVPGKVRGGEGGEQACGRERRVAPAARERQHAKRGKRKGNAGEDRRGRDGKLPGCDRGGDRIDDNSGRQVDAYDPLRARRRLDRVRQAPMHQIAGQHGKQRTDQERRIGRPPEQRHAGNKLVDRAKHRRQGRPYPRLRSSPEIPRWGSLFCEFGR